MNYNKIKLHKIGLSFLISVSFVSCGQNRQEKTNAIIEKLKIVENIESDIVSFKIWPLKYQVTGTDSIKLVELENKLTEDEFLKRINQAFDELYSEKEINDTYDFINTTAFEKFFNSGQTYKAIYKQFDDINKELEQISKKNNEIFKKTQTKFEPIPIDRRDGFYETVDYNSSSEYKFINLKENPSLTNKDILEVKKAFDNDRVYIDLTLTKEGAKKFYILTKNNISKPIAIVLEKYIVYLPIVNSEIVGGKVSISGDFSEKQIDQMIEKLKVK